MRALTIAMAPPRFAVALAFVGLMLPHFPTRPLLLWWLMLLVVSLARLRLGWHFRRDPAWVARLPTWSRRFTLGAVAAGLAWAWGPSRTAP